MKKMLLTFSIVFSQVSFASIADSKYEARHLNLIETSIVKNCGNFKNLTQVDSNEKVIIIDQGIRDVQFKTKLTGLQRMDQNIFDEYEIVVESEYGDMYDHNSQNWGVYNVTSVSCSIK
jgi:hypothetical protein